MSRTTNDFQDHCNKVEGFEAWWDEHRRRIDDDELRRMYEEQSPNGLRNMIEQLRLRQTAGHLR